MKKELKTHTRVFIDTAPFIYYLEGNPEFGDLSREIIEKLPSLEACTSVITLTEVLIKPVEEEKLELIQKFEEFFLSNPFITLVEIDQEIARQAGKLRGKYKFLRTMDALQLATALSRKSQTFVTNDKKLAQFQEGLEIMVLRDYL